jgi:hypothetical protein
MQPDTIAGFLAAGLTFEVRCNHCTRRTWLSVDDLVDKRPELIHLTIDELLVRMRCTGYWCGKRGANLIDVTRRYSIPDCIPAPLGLDAERWAAADVAERVAMIRSSG